MSPRNPFAFLDDETPQRRTLILLLAILRKQGGDITLTVDDLAAIEDGASFHKFLDDTSTALVLRFARRGAEAYFLTATEDSSSPTTPTSRVTRVQRPIHPLAPESSSPTSPATRHAVHDDVDLALREEEMAQRAESAQRDRLRQARAESGGLPWRTRP